MLANRSDFNIWMPIECVWIPLSDEALITCKACLENWFILVWNLNLTTSTHHWYLPSWIMGKKSDFPSMWQSLKYLSITIICFSLLLIQANVAWFLSPFIVLFGFPWWLIFLKNLLAMQGTGLQFQSPGWEDPLEKGMATHSTILAWRIPGQRSLAGYRPWGHKESGMTKWLTLLLLLSYMHTAEHNPIYL